MRKLMLATTAAALLAGISFANAADIVGTVKSINPATMMVTLDSGQSYKLPATAKATDWKVGDRIKLTTDSNNVVTAANAAEVIGTIKSIDPLTMMVTLDSGKSYKLPATVKATDWKVGDKIKLTTDDKDNVTAVTKA